MILESKKQAAGRAAIKPVEIPVPFVGQGQGTGLGDLIARLTRAVGIEPCGACNKRKEELNNRVRFGPWET